MIVETAPGRKTRSRANDLNKLFTHFLCAPPKIGVAEFLVLLVS